MKDAVTALLSDAIDSLRQDNIITIDKVPDIKVERTKDKQHGELASNIALAMAKAAKLPPRALAEHIVNALPANDTIADTQIAGPGFINFFLNQASRSAIVSDILAQGKQFGRCDAGNNQSVQVEFVSANPTGPLHVGHGRGGAVGDCICRLLEATGWRVTREFYYNDAGQQIDNLARSVQLRCQGIGPENEAWPEDGYRGDYIIDVAQAYLRGDTVSARDISITADGDAENLDAIRQFAVAYLRHEQDQDLSAFGITFDVFFLESSLYQDGKVDSAVKQLIDNGHCYESEGALWLRTTDFGDDKDRVMRKRDGGYTYFVPDVAYHLDKWQRGFTHVINEQGADHHSTITRVRAGLQGLDAGIPEGWPDYVLHQMVLVMRNGEEVKLSKRAGSYVTLRDLIDEVGRDATRYFLAARKPDSQLTFDIDLALAQSNDNPVYYIQYAHARICSVLRQADERALSWDPNAGTSALDQLNDENETALLGKLASYPDILRRAAAEHAPHQIAQYLRELAAALHTWYNSSQFIVDDSGLRNARLSLAAATRQVLANGLDLLGVSAPESM